MAASGQSQQKQSALPPITDDDLARLKTLATIAHEDSSGERWEAHHWTVHQGQYLMATASAEDTFKAEYIAAADPIQVLALVQEIHRLRSWVLGFAGPSTAGDSAAVLSALRAQEGISHEEATGALARLARDAALGRECVELAKGHGWSEGSGAQLAEFLESMLDGPGMVRLGAGENERRLTEAMRVERDETGLALVRGMVADHKRELSSAQQREAGLVLLLREARLWMADDQDTTVTLDELLPRLEAALENPDTAGNALLAERDGARFLLDEWRQKIGLPEGADSDDVAQVREERDVYRAEEEDRTARCLLSSASAGKQGRERDTYREENGALVLQALGLKQEVDELHSLLSERDAQLEDVGRVLGKVCVYATLAAHEAPAERPDHPATACMWRLVQERHMLSRALDEVLEVAADVDGLTEALTEATGDLGTSRAAAESLSRKLLALGRVTDTPTDTDMDLQAGGRGMTLAQVRAAFPYAAVVAEPAALSDAELAALVADACKAQGKALPGAEPSLTVKPTQVLALARETQSIRGRSGVRMITHGVAAAARARALGCDETTTAEAAAWAAGCYVLGEDSFQEPLSPVPVSLVDTFRQLDAHLVAFPHPGADEARERLARLERWTVSLVCTLVPFRDVALEVGRATEGNATVPIPLPVVVDSEESLLSGDFLRLLALLSDDMVKGLKPSERLTIPPETPRTLELIEAVAELLFQHVPDAERTRVAGLVTLLRRKWGAMAILSGKLDRAERRHALLERAFRCHLPFMGFPWSDELQRYIPQPGHPETCRCSGCDLLSILHGGQPMQVVTASQVVRAAQHIAQSNGLSSEVITGEMLHFLGLQKP